MLQGTYRTTPGEGTNGIAYIMVHSLASVPKAAARDLFLQNISSLTVIIHWGIPVVADVMFAQLEELLHPIDW